MFDVRQIVRGARFAALLAAALAISACAQNANDAQGNAAAAPGSQQDFVVNVGDRVFFETDSSELTPQSRATLDKQAQWLNNYSQYGQFTVEGHADERGTREYNIALGARRAQTVRDYLTSRGVAANRMRLTLTEGSILNVVAMSGKPSASSAALADIAYATLAAMTRGEAKEWADQGIRINAVGPRTANGSTPASGADIAALALYLASKKGRGLSGTMLDAGGTATRRC